MHDSCLLGYPVSVRRNIVLVQPSLKINAREVRRHCIALSAIWVAEGALLQIWEGVRVWAVLEAGRAFACVKGQPPFWQEQEHCASCEGYDSRTLCDAMLYYGHHLVSSALSKKHGLNAEIPG